jgi:hypothetical protein
MKSFKQYVTEETQIDESTDWWKEVNTEDLAEDLLDEAYVHFAPRRKMNGMVGGDWKLSKHAAEVHKSLMNSPHKAHVAKSYSGMGNHSFTITVKRNDAVDGVIKHVEKHFPKLTSMRGR